MLEIKERRDLFDDVIAALQRDDAKTALDILTKQFVIFVGAVSVVEPCDVTAGMTPWSGGNDQPTDYHGGKVLRRNGRVDYPGSGPYTWKHDPRWPDAYDIIAYTPFCPCLCGGDPFICIKADGS
jgi:hypothetical protein